MSQVALVKVLAVVIAFENPTTLPVPGRGGQHHWHHHFAIALLTHGKSIGVPLAPSPVPTRSAPPRRRQVCADDVAVPDSLRAAGLPAVCNSVGSGAPRLPGVRTPGLCDSFAGTGGRGMPPLPAAGTSLPTLSASRQAFQLSPPASKQHQAVSQQIIALNRALDSGVTPQSPRSRMPIHPTPPGPAKPPRGWARSASCC